MRSLILFAPIQAIAFFLGSSDATTISLIVLVIAVVVFAFAYLSAFRKDKRNRKSTVTTVFELQ